MSLSSEHLHQNADRKAWEHKGADELFLKPAWLKLNSVVTSLLDIEGETERLTAAMKNDLRMVALAGLPVSWDKPELAPFRDADKILVDLRSGCR